MTGLAAIVASAALALPPILQGLPTSGPNCKPKDPRVALALLELRIARETHVIWRDHYLTHPKGRGSLDPQWDATWVREYDRIISQFCKLVRAARR